MATGNAVEKVQEAGGVVASAPRPALTAGAAVAGLAGGFALGARLSPKRRRVLGVPLGRKRGALVTLAVLGKAARELSSTSDDIRQVREELEMANRRSPVEVLLDGLTHRRGAHRRES